MPPDAGPKPTTLRGKWHLDGELGRGGMATVYAATHRNGLRGAIKLLHAHYANDEKIRARLLREGYLANKIQHGGIVKVLDDDVTEDGCVFLVMELLEGQTLKARWSEAGGRLPPEEALDVCDAVLDVLAAAHALGVVHRDVKPDNVFLTSAGVVKVLDFGIAGLKESAGEMTHTSEMLGTPAFMSPEQALAHWSEVDARSDLFATGAMLFTLLSGELVHRARTVPELLVAAATRPARSLAAALPEVSPALAAVVDKALAFAPEARWQTAAEMRSALRRARSALRPGTVRIDLAQAPPHIVAAIFDGASARAADPASPGETDASEKASDANATVELASPLSPPPKATVALAPTLAAELSAAVEGTRLASIVRDPAPPMRQHATVPLLDPVRPLPERPWNVIDPTHHAATRSVGAPPSSRASVVAAAWLGGVALALVGLLAYRLVGGPAPTATTVTPAAPPPPSSAVDEPLPAPSSALLAQTSAAAMTPSSTSSVAQPMVVPTTPAATRALPSSRPTTIRPAPPAPPAFTERPSEKPAPIR